MTIFEFFKEQYDKAVEEGCGTTKCCAINPEIPKGSFRWVQLASKHFFGGAYQPTFEKCGITLAQLKEAKESGIVKYWYNDNWLARQMNKKDHWSLTAKGLKALYKAYEGQW
jgi:hypothetical protein